MCNKICIAFDDISVEINGFDSEDDKLLYFGIVLLKDLRKT